MKNISTRCTFKDSGLIARLWSMICYPFQRSIHLRFRYAFGFSAFGLAFITVITFVSDRMLLNTYELNITQAQMQMMPLQRLREALRVSDELVFHYANGEDQSAPSHMKKISALVESEIQHLSDGALDAASLGFARPALLQHDAMTAWREAQVSIDRVFQQTPGSNEAIKALAAVHEAIDPIYVSISELHDLSMQNLQDRLNSAHSIVRWSMYTIFAAILAGLGILIGLGRILGRSILHPIAELQEAAHKLAGKDFSHRVKLRNQRDELGQLGKAFNIAASTIQRLHFELEQRSSHDGLTGVFNRAAFDARFSVECRNADRQERPLSLLMVDVDFFKRVNDNFGHQTGDRLLQTIAQTLKAEIRPGDVLARYGGEEFVVILPNTSENSAMAIAERLRRTIAQTSIQSANGVEISVTTSIGCASRAPHTVTAGSTLEAADAALFRAKKAGRNRVVSAAETAHSPTNRGSKDPAERAPNKETVRRSPLSGSATVAE
ncbi:MAG: diguanylate cyclase [Rhizobiaceae bacterium]|nr:diguanylate cyclase [Rhizobiaceae bacterium]